MEKRQPTAILMEMEIGAATIEKEHVEFLKVFKKKKKDDHKIAISLLGIH